MTFGIPSSRLDLIFPGGVCGEGAANARFTYRVAGIVLNGDQILLQGAEQDDFWALPGGRIRLLETAEDALRREMREELSVVIQVERLIWVVENFFHHDGEAYHELGLYFLMTFAEDPHLYRQREAFSGDEDGLKLIFKWHRLDELTQTPLYPSFLQTALNDLPQGSQHIVHRDP